MGKVLKNKSLLKKYIPTRKVWNKEEPVKFGAVYFRRSGPPEEDWERDYARAVKDGHTLFRHWFTWSAINYAPGKYNWEPYDRQLDLAAKYGIKTIIAEFVNHTPDWLYKKYPHARSITREGHQRPNEMRRACSTGGARGMCLHNPKVKEAAEEYLKELAKRYHDHPGLYGYDIFNEYTLYTPKNRCYCEATRQKFIKWLQQKYKDFEELKESWFRYSLSDWNDIQIPRQNESYPEFYDFINFYVDDLQEMLKWRIDTIKKYDSKHLITAHGEGFSFNDIAPAAADDWRLGELVEVSGYSQSTMYSEVDPLFTGDTVRMASRGKEFWHAEAPGSTSWPGRYDNTSTGTRDMMLDPENIRMECFMSLITGAKAFMSPRWRPLLDGPFFEAFGWYDIDGSPTDRSEMVAELAEWANDPERSEMWQAKPVKGELGLLIIEEAQAYSYATSDKGSTNYYGLDYSGVYKAFRDSNIQCDPIRREQVGSYDFIYAPFPVALKDSTISLLLNWVKDGGRLVLEGCPGYVNENGHLITQRLGRGLSEALSCKEFDAHLGPDKWSNLKVYSGSGEISGGLYRQSYKVNEGKEMGEYKDGSTAIVGNDYGKGKIMAVGTMPGYAYQKDPDEKTRRWFASLLQFADKEPYVRVPYNNNIIARIQASEDKVCLWLLNKSKKVQDVKIYLNQELFTVRDIKLFRGEDAEIFEENAIRAEVKGRDAVVIDLF